MTDATRTKRGKPRQRVARGAPLIERILLHTDRSGECWIWTASIDSHGYGRIQVDGRLRYAHRIAYEAVIGSVAEGFQLDHLCRVRACVNPEHLEPVTPAVNVARGTSPGAIAQRRDMCLYGVHAYSEHGVVRAGRRVCRECQRIYAALHRRVPYAEAMSRNSAGLPVVDLAAYFAEQERAA